MKYGQFCTQNVENIDKKKMTKNVQIIFVSKDAQCSETNAKSISKFLVFEIWSILY